MLSDLYALRKTYASIHSNIAGIGSPTLVVGLIKGGINTNVVPDTVTFRIDRRIIPEENPAQVEADLTRQIHEFARRWPGIKVNVKRILLAVPFVPIAGQERLVAALQRHGEAIIGEPLRTHGVPIYTDARLYTTARCRPCSTAPGRARWWKPTAIAPTKSSISTTSPRPPPSSRWHWPTCSPPPDRA